MTEQDSYTFTNPFAGDWNPYEISVRENKNDTSSHGFSMDEWDVKISIEVSRKQKPIEVGSEWRTPGRHWRTVSVIGAIVNLDQSYVVFIDEEHDADLLKEGDFRAQFKLVDQ